MSKVLVEAIWDQADWSKNGDMRIIGGLSYTKNELYDELRDAFIEDRYADGAPTDDWPWLLDDTWECGEVVKTSDCRKFGDMFLTRAEFAIKLESFFKGCKFYSTSDSPVAEAVERSRITELMDNVLIKAIWDQAPPDGASERASPSLRVFHRKVYSKRILVERLALIYTRGKTNIIETDFPKDELAEGVWGCGKLFCGTGLRRFGEVYYTKLDFTNALKRLFNSELNVTGEQANVTQNVTSPEAILDGHVALLNKEVDELHKRIGSLEADRYMLGEDAKKAQGEFDELLLRAGRLAKFFTNCSINEAYNIAERYDQDPFVIKGLMHSAKSIIERLEGDDE